MKKLLLTMTLFVCAAQINAQSEWDPSYLGLKAGFNYATNTFTNPSLTDMESNYKTGFAGGIYCNIGFCSKFAVQTELMYSSMGSKLKSTTGDQSSESTLKLDYISVPMLFKFIPTPKLGIFAGPQFDFRLGAELTDGNVESIKGTDFAGTAGLEYWFNNNLGLYARYIYGFQNINDKDPGIAYNLNPIPSEVHNTGIQVGITLGFKVKKEGMAPVESKSGLVTPSVIADTDSDGVSDKDDKCPNTPGIAGNMGCPEMIIYFQREEAGLTDDDKANLDKVVTFMNNNPGLKITVEGHTSTPGGDAFNKTLSEKRASEVVDYMVSKGISKKRMHAMGLGEEFPVGDNTTEEGKAKSRRVVIKIAK